jgi:hypothetical protein
VTKNHQEKFFFKSQKRAQNSALPKTRGTTPAFKSEAPNIEQKKASVAELQSEKKTPKMVHISVCRARLSGKNPTI